MHMDITQPEMEVIGCQCSYTNHMSTCIYVVHSFKYEFIPFVHLFLLIFFGGVAGGGGVGGDYRH